MDTIINRLPPGARHALVALAIQVASALLLWLAYLVMPTPVFLLAAGGLCGVWFYAGRERRQAEEAAGSNAIPITQILPRSYRDVGWPALAATLCWLLVWLLGR